MQIKEIAELIEIIENSGIEEFEMERSGVRVRIRKGATAVPQSPALELQAVPGGEVEVPETEPVPEAGESLYTFTAPIVGTFYSSPKPDAESFVKAGDAVGKGAVLCIIEAMKIFNQIECDVDGEVVRILVENGQPVEYGEPLFEIRPSS